MSRIMFQFFRSRIATEIVRIVLSASICRTLNVWYVASEIPPFSPPILELSEVYKATQTQRSAIVPYALETQERPRWYLR
jgi:hypothetical protein